MESYLQFDSNIIILTSYTGLQNSENIPPGYEPVSLLEALNGVQPASPALPSAPLYEEVQYPGEMDDPLTLSMKQQSTVELSADPAALKSKLSKSPDG